MTQTIKAMMRCLLPGLCLVGAFSSAGYCADTLQVQLAKLYRSDMDVSAFLVSEKYDGIRAVWKNGRLQTRNGEPIHAPDWFTESLPKTWLDGELWSKRRDYETVSSVVRKTIPVDSEWRTIKYMVFDAPDHKHTFQDRVARYTKLLTDAGLAHVKPVAQFRVSGRDALMSRLKEYTQQGAEGLMLHRADAMYRDGRSDNLLKLKTYMDDEAVVIGHIPGKGKYTGMMGSIKVRWIDDTGKAVIFKIGTGFSDRDRAEPPSIGSTITFKYYGVSKKGIPKFASYLRQRNSSHSGSQIGDRNAP